MMKKIIFIIACLLMTTGVVSSCGGTEKKTETPSPKADVYMCPMKCDDQKYDKPGKCSVCNMDLEKVSEG